MPATPVLDAIVIGGGHNGLVAAGILARAGRSVLILERRHEVGGAVLSGQPFPGVKARLSRFAYLVSLLPRAVVEALGLEVELRPRGVQWYAPGFGFAPADDGDEPGWTSFQEMLSRVARRVFPTLTEPLLSPAEMRRRIDDEQAWRALFEEPLAPLLERTFRSDVVRGAVCTDGLIGTFAAADDLTLRQNRCFLYHVIGNGTGRWDVPVGGMGVISSQLALAAQRAGAQIRTGVEVTGVVTDGSTAEVVYAGGERRQARHVLAGIAPAELARLMGESAGAERPEGSQLKLNLLLTRLPRLRDPVAAPERAFAGTLHVNESYEQLQHAYAQALEGGIPDHPPCDVYCHSLTDPSILSPELQRAGAHALTVFGLHMPARLFAGRAEERKREAVAATLRSINSVLAEPLEDCLWRDVEGHPCLEALSPLDLERELAMPGGHIFHRDLPWPFAESEDEVGRWGVETDHPNVWLCGAGARRGGGVSGIAGFNAARAVLTAG